MANSTQSRLARGIGAAPNVVAAGARAGAGT